MSNMHKLSMKKGMNASSLQHKSPSSNKLSILDHLMETDSARRIRIDKCNGSRLQSVLVGHMSAGHKNGLSDT